ncbi:hypothetical protein [Burkholderia guangdongensis]|uniref:hypothetical protein n=1 Tax=Burkholderia guangdongensis TaxID=1792500 RepID=UPI0015C8C53D|nr:hypothetical protein [Burkholderia guangdongensis]
MNHPKRLFEIHVKIQKIHSDQQNRRNLLLNENTELYSHMALNRVMLAVNVGNDCELLKKIDKIKMTPITAVAAIAIFLLMSAMKLPAVVICDSLRSSAGNCGVKPPYYCRGPGHSSSRCAANRGCTKACP